MLKAKGKEKKNRRFTQNHLVNPHILIYVYRGKLHNLSLVVTEINEGFSLRKWGNT